MDDLEGEDAERRVKQKEDEDGQGDKEEKDGKKEPTVSDEYNSEDADISLISSDNVLFKVHSYRLMTAS
jgi:hypothetical protein